MFSQPSKPVYHDAIKKLTAQGIKEILEKAKEKYLTGNEQDPRTTTHYNRASTPIICKTHITDVTNKNIFSLGTSYLFRFFKANLRLPTISDDTSNEKARESLVAFLKGDGGNDLASLKYMVASQIMNQYKKDDNSAKELIEDLSGEKFKRVNSFDSL